MFAQTVIVFCLASASFARVIYNDFDANAINDHFEYPIGAVIFEDLSGASEPHSKIRVRRQSGITGSITPGNPGITGTIGAQGNIFNKNGHSLDAHGQVSRTYHPAGPTSVGGGLNYQGPRGGVSADVNHVHRFGTGVNVGGNANVWKSNNGRSSFDVNGNYNRHFGGPGGTGRPNHYVGGQFTHRF